MKNISFALAMSFALVSGFVGFGIGYSFTPEYRLSAFEKNPMDAEQTDRWTDLRYVNAMIAHHRGAMMLSREALEKGSRKEVRELAGEILKNEPAAIEELFRWKEAWYGDSRDVRDPIVPALGDQGETFDLRFLNALIAHHESGIEMTRDIRLRSSRAEVLDNADSVEAFLLKSRDSLSSWRKEWFGI